MKKLFAILLLVLCSAAAHAQGIGRETPYFQTLKTNATSAQLVANLTNAFYLPLADHFLTPAVAAASYQPLDASLTSFAGITPSANGLSLISAANYASMRALLDLEAGIDFLSPAAIAAAYQPLSANLTTLAGNDGSGLTGLNASNLASGTVPTARLGTGTANSSTFLRGDGAWATPAGGGGGSLNNIVEDTTPQLGGNLDAQSNDISGVDALAANSVSVTTGISVAGDDPYDADVATAFWGMFDPAAGSDMISGWIITNVNARIQFQDTTKHIGFNWGGTTNSSITLNRSAGGDGYIELRGTNYLAAGGNDYSFLGHTGDDLVLGSFAGDIRLSSTNDIVLRSRSGGEIYMQFQSAPTNAMVRIDNVGGTNANFYLRAGESETGDDFQLWTRVNEHSATFFQTNRHRFVTGDASAPVTIENGNVDASSFSGDGSALNLDNADLSNNADVQAKVDATDGLVTRLAGTYNRLTPNSSDWGTVTNGASIALNLATNVNIGIVSGATMTLAAFSGTPSEQSIVTFSFDNTSGADTTVAHPASTIHGDDSGTVTTYLAPPGRNRLVFIYESGGWVRLSSPVQFTDPDLLHLINNGITGSGPLVASTGATITDLTLDDLIVGNLELPELVSAPSTPTAGKLRVYALDDGNVYSKDDAGVVVNLSAASGSGTTNATLILVTNVPASYTPDDTFVEGHLKGVDAALASLGAWSPLVVDTASTAVTPLHTNSVSADVTRYSQARIIATQQTNSAAFYVTAVANNTGGSLTLVTNALERLTNSVTATWDAFFSASGANLVLNALGPAEGVSWKVVQLNTWTHTNFLGASSAYLFEDLFEDAALNTNIWTEIVGDGLSASTSSPLDGTRSLLSADPVSGPEYITSLDIGADYDTVWFGFVLNIETPNSNGRQIIRIRNAANDTDLAQVLVNTSRQYASLAVGGTTTSYSTTDVIPNTAGQKIPMMIRYTRGTGANGTFATFTSTDNTTWTQSHTSSNGTSTEYARRLRFINNSAWNMGIRVDRVLAKTSEMTPDEILNGL